MGVRVCCLMFPLVLNVSLEHRKIISSLIVYHSINTHRYRFALNSVATFGGVSNADEYT